MRYRPLGSSGTLVSELCLGGMTFGGPTPNTAAQRIIEEFLDIGGNFFDVADSYNQGEAERVIGEAVRARRDDVILATKAGLRVDDGPNDIGNSRTHLLQSVDRSLRHLHTDYIDLFQLHCWDPLTPLEETLEAIGKLVKQGKVRYFGVSNFSGWQLSKIVMLARQSGLPEPVTAQQQYSLVERTIEREVVPAATEFGISILAWGPLGGGFLSGKYQRDADPPKGSRLQASLPWMEEYWGRRSRERCWKILDAARSVADDLGCSVAQVALRWLLDQQHVCSPLVGARTEEQARDNFGVLDISLSTAQFKRLEEASALEAEYVQRFQHVAMAHRVDYDPKVHPRVGLR